MAADTLNLGLRQIAEDYLARSLSPDEEQQLLSLQQNIQSQAPAAPSQAQLARQQVQRTIAQGQIHANSTMREILESIQASSSKALQVQETEEQAILKLLESSQSLAELRPSSLQPAMAGLQASSQLALTQIADHLSNLAKKEVENCFNQYFGPLTQQLQAVVTQLQNEQIKAADTSSATQASAPAPSEVLHNSPTTTSMQ
ncbi:hypothetical protein [Chitinimonas sp. BJB300]|uniref:hypothetical protein n=1 Tax=Chitinimonas sp. BJB300 TaxID=1559339 RepID=UPI000C0EFDEE|nr:hypothetical protein [Chitinimonas sp. BJB300]PHV09713.1 hypothetical protein CSQ89_20195 [Chitinimonas sp. BJB300]TSJ91293.1 hypothetical protein FG002_003100 [Chitinimonas sp. BJB300]